MTDDYMPDRFTVSIERFRDEEGNPENDRIPGLSIPCEDPFAEDEPEELLQLRGVASSLTGRLADIYEWLLVKYAGGKVKLSLQDIANKWGISKAQAYKDKDRIIRMIQKSIEANRKTGEY